MSKTVLARFLVSLVVLLGQVSCVASVERRTEEVSASAAAGFSAVRGVALLRDGGLPIAGDIRDASDEVRDVPRFDGRAVASTEASDIVFDFISPEAFREDLRSGRPRAEGEFVTQCLTIVATFTPRGDPEQTLADVRLLRSSLEEVYGPCWRS